jgi:hypothetical protein
MVLLGRQITFRPPVNELALRSRPADDVAAQVPGRTASPFGIKDLHAERGRARVPVPQRALDAILAKVAPGPTAADA